MFRGQRVRVLLDWSKGELTFSDPDTKAVTHTFRHTFTDRMYPYVNTSSDLPLKILPVKLSVKQQHSWRRITRRPK